MLGLGLVFWCFDVLVFWCFVVGGLCLGFGVCWWFWFGFCLGLGECWWVLVLLFLFCLIFVF